MNISISVAATPCAMPQIMFAGDLEARCALLAGLGYDGIDMFFPDPQGTVAGYHACSAGRSHGRRFVFE